METEEPDVRCPLRPLWEGKAPGPSSPTSSPGLHLPRAPQIPTMAPTHRVLASGLTSTGLHWGLHSSCFKAVAVVSLLGKYLCRPRRRLAGRQGPPRLTPRPGWGCPSGQGAALHPAGFVAVLNCTPSTQVLPSWKGHCDPLGCEMQFT